MEMDFVNSLTMSPEWIIVVEFLIASINKFFENPYQNIGIVVGLITVYGIYYNIQRNRKTQSVLLTVDYLEKQLNTNQPIIDLIKLEKKDEYPKRELEILLDFLENVAIFRKQKIIDEKHIQGQLGYLLTLIGKDKQITDYILECQDDDEELYTAIQNYLEKRKSKNWLVYFFRHLLRTHHVLF